VPRTYEDVVNPLFYLEFQDWREGLKAMETEKKRKHEDGNKPS
jgi:hypothetical protein